MKIEHLKYNSSTLPKSIYKYFCSLGNQRSFSVVNGKTTYYDLLPPFNRSFLFIENGTEYSCFILEKYYELFKIYLSRGEIKDEKGNVLNEKTIYEFLVDYAKGFNKGYNDFKDTISKTDLFEKSNTDLAYKIFERVYPSFTRAKDGNITVTKGDFHNKKLKQYITKELFYEAGYEGGEFFKAWELILKSPLLFKSFFDEITTLRKALTPQTDTKRKPKSNVKLITFKNSETIEKIHTELKGFFPKKEDELLKALQGEELTEILLFPHNQNKFVEVFRRLKYNGFLLNTDTETKNWICSTFQFIKNGFTEPQPFNERSVWDNLNKGKGEPTRKERICITDWLQYKSLSQLRRETENEKLL
ncbi:MAG: hypothetical protein IPK10_12290 [Bacteroidetes bacterium]|nr:hypothetical protein [Bacteroidota bacterium]